jgi:hypothetical protein
MVCCVPSQYRFPLLTFAAFGQFFSIAANALASQRNDRLGHRHHMIRHAVGVIFVRVSSRPNLKFCLKRPWTGLANRCVVCADPIQSRQRETNNSRQRPPPKMFFRLLFPHHLTPWLILRATIAAN